MKHRNTHVEVVNKRSTYNEIKLSHKPTADITSFSHFVKSKTLEESHQIVRQNFSDEIHVIEIQMRKFVSSLKEFMVQTTTDYNRILTEVDRMKESLAEVKKEVRKS